MEKNNPRSQVISLNAPARARLFFALWPEDACRKQLAATARQLATACGGRVMRPETLHMTLLFLGPVERGRIPALEAASAELRFTNFALEMEHLACWRHNKIAYAAPRETPEALAHLVARLAGTAEAAGIGFDRKPFMPHVTLLRNIERNFDAQTISPLRWSVGSFSLVESMLTAYGARYRILRTWGAN